MVVPPFWEYYIIFDKNLMEDGCLVLIEGKHISLFYEVVMS